MTSISYDRTDVFISYSHKDEQYMERLKTHLAFDVRRGSLSVWEDTQIAPGSPWRGKIDEAIKKTRIAILLVSADFLASDYITTTELPPLLAAAKTEGAIIIPVILSASAFQRTALAQFQGVNSPSKPLSGMSRNDKEKTWAEIVERVRLELSKVSEYKPNWTQGSTIDNVRGITPAFQLLVGPDRAVELFKQFEDNKIADYVVIDLSTGPPWLTSRLYIFAIMLERMRGLRCFVFLETRDDVNQRFLGIASPNRVRWALARRYPWLEMAFAKAYFNTSGLRILSTTGALDREVAQEVVYHYLSNPNIQQLLPPNTSPNPDDDEWEFRRTEDGLQLWEHAKWLDATLLGQDLSDILQRDESAWLVESPTSSYTEQVRSILRRKGSFVALLDEQMRFKSLIDRQDFLEREVVGH
jgi:hypothetical protein